MRLSFIRIDCFAGQEVIDIPIIFTHLFYFIFSRRIYFSFWSVHAIGILVLTSLLVLLIRCCTCKLQHINIRINQSSFYLIYVRTVYRYCGCFPGSVYYLLLSKYFFFKKAKSKTIWTQDFVGDVSMSIHDNLTVCQWEVDTGLGR